jgi:hypothetical protein
LDSEKVFVDFVQIELQFSAFNRIWTRIKRSLLFSNRISTKTQFWEPQRSHDFEASEGGEWVVCVVRSRKVGVGSGNSVMFWPKEEKSCFWQWIKGLFWQWIKEGVDSEEETKLICNGGIWSGVFWVGKKWFVNSKKRGIFVIGNFGLVVRRFFGYNEFSGSYRSLGVRWIFWSLAKLRCRWFFGSYRSLLAISF